MSYKKEVVKCWYEKATDLYLITPMWWSEKANSLYFPGRELVPCKAPALTTSIRRLSERMMKEHYNIWMDAETYLEHTEAKMKEEDEAMKDYIMRKTQICSTPYTKKPRKYLDGL